MQDLEFKGGPCCLLSLKWSKQYKNREGTPDFQNTFSAVS